MQEQTLKQQEDSVARQEAMRRSKLILYYFISIFYHLAILHIV